jgi:hypothetical protein
MGIRALLVHPEMPPTCWSLRGARLFLERGSVSGMKNRALQNPWIRW